VGIKERIKIGQANQLYCKWKRILFNPDDPNELYIVVAKDKPMTRETALEFDERFKEMDVIITVTKLIRGKKKNDERE